MKGVLYWPAETTGTGPAGRADLAAMMLAAATAAAPVELAYVERLDAEILRGAEVLVLSDAHVSADVVELVLESSVQWVQLSSSGAERSQLTGLCARITVTSAVSVWAPAVADHAVALLLALFRRVPELLRQQTTHQWAPTALAPVLRSVGDATVAVLGCGSIGGAVASRLAGFDARVVGITRDGRPRSTGPFDEYVGVDRLTEVLRTADALVVCVPLGPQTHHIVGAAELAALGPDGLVVNVGRGALLDQASLVAALVDGRLGGAALDVTDPEPLPGEHLLWDVERLILSPHVATMPAGRSAGRRLGDLVGENARRLRAGLPLVHPVPPT